MLQTGSRPDDRRGKDYGKRKKAESGQKVSLEDEVCADNIPVHKNEKKVLLLFNKPRGSCAVQSSSLMRRR